jgi:hypothetical protein
MRTSGLARGVAALGFAVLFAAPAATRAGDVADMASAKSMAAESGKPLLLDFSTSW